MLDPDDCELFAQAADEIADFRNGQVLKGKATEKLTNDLILAFLIAGLSCPTISSSAVNTCNEVVVKAELDPEPVGDILELRTGRGVQSNIEPRLLSRPERFSLAQSTYAELRVGLDLPSLVSAEGKAAHEEA